MFEGTKKRKSYYCEKKKYFVKRKAHLNQYFLYSSKIWEHKIRLNSPVFDRRHNPGKHKGKIFYLPRNLNILLLALQMSYHSVTLALHSLSGCSGFQGLRTYKKQGWTSLSFETLRMEKKSSLYFLNFQTWSLLAFLAEHYASYNCNTGRDLLF